MNLGENKGSPSCHHISTENSLQQSASVMCVCVFFFWGGDS